MSYVIYDRNTTQILTIHRKNSYQKKSSYPTMAAAKAGLTRYAKKNPGAEFDYAIAEFTYYQDKIEKQVEKTNMMTGKKYMESVNTPGYMSPSSEAYWSM